MYALCVGSVAATKSAKDKGFSRVFMWAKVGRKELCQGGKFFRVFGEGFLSWAIEMSAIQGPELRGGVWGLSFCGEKGGCLSRALCGERCGSSGLTEGMRLCEGGFVLSAYFV